MNPLLLVAGTAAVTSERGRRWLRQGAVYGVATGLAAADAVRNATEGVGSVASTAAGGVTGAMGSVTESFGNVWGDAQARHAPGSSGNGDANRTEPAKPTPAPKPRATRTRRTAAQKAAVK